MNFCNGTAGVAMNIRQALLNNAKNRGFQVSRESAKGVRYDEFGPYAGAFCETIEIPLKSQAKAGVIEEWRMEQMRNDANLSDGLADQALCLR